MEYYIFPYSFKKIENDILLINSASEYLFIPETEFRKFKEDPNLCLPETIQHLKEKYFIAEQKEKDAAKYIFEVKKETKHSYIMNDVLLLMVVPTISCNCNCIYCQVNSKDNQNELNNIKFDTVLLFCDFVFALPHKNIKIEFQGGEPLLAFDLIKFIVLRISFFNHKYKKYISFVICTNLLKVSTFEIQFIKKHKIEISTSLDGPREIHDRNRPSKFYRSTFEASVKNIKRLRHSKVYPSALVTITNQNLFSMQEIIDTYIEQGFLGIFIRPLNNYGKAFSNLPIKYNLNEFMDNYKKAIDYIIRKNFEGINIKEEYFTILLRKILTPFNDGFVDMQNPCALGQMCMIVDQNGDIFPCDEARMISEMGNKYWKMSNLHNQNCLQEIQENQIKIRQLGRIEEKKYCEDCAYKPLCFTDPIKEWYIRNYSKDDYCGIKKEMFDFVFFKIKNADQKEMHLFWKWAND